MTVLVASASRHGATHEIGEAIAAELAGAGIAVDVKRIEDISELADYEAVVLGSSVYMGGWLEPAKQFVEQHAEQLAGRPSWIFSSGPTGDPPRPAADKAVQIEPIVAAIKPREHRLFAGKLDKDKLSFGERALVLAVRGAEGDFRAWDEIKAWARGIAATLHDEP